MKMWFSEKRSPEKNGLVLVGSDSYWSRRRREQIFGRITDMVIGAGISAIVSCIVGTIWQHSLHAEQKYWDDYVAGLSPTSQSIIITPPAKSEVWNPQNLQQLSPF